VSSSFGFFGIFVLWLMCWFALRLVSRVVWLSFVFGLLCVKSWYR